MTAPRYSTSSRELETSDEVYGSKNSKNNEVVTITQAGVRACKRFVTRISERLTVLGQEC